mgnify:CR=1 FL=1
MQILVSHYQFSKKSKRLISDILYLTNMDENDSDVEIVDVISPTHEARVAQESISYSGVHPEVVRLRGPSAGKPVKRTMYF